ncbi:MAG TPA: hypothetical protein VEL74_17275 [Thermoanaerobaculia bacterium]|nr:hypothetical protein [Thermoanaerobaculia bacterium]
MNTLLDGLVMAALLAAWGAQAVAPWRLASRLPGRPEEARRFWGYTILPLYAGGVLAALSWAHTHPDATVAAGLVPITSSPWGRALAILAVALLAADLVAVVGRRRLEDAGWRILGGFGLAALAAVCLVAELLRAGEGPVSPLPVTTLAAACRLLVALAAGEALAPFGAGGRPLLALAAAPALGAWFFVVPAGLADALVRSGALLTAGAAAVLFLAARWLPASLRRPGLAAAALLAGLFFAQAAAVSQALGAPVFSPLPPLPGPG